MQMVGEKLTLVGADTRSVSAKLDAIGTETRHSSGMLRDIGSNVNVTNTTLSAMGTVLGNLDARFTNMVPRLFYIVPAEKKNAFLHPREYLKSKATTKYNLYFVCSHTKRLVDAAPVKVRLNKEWFVAAAPVPAVSLKLVQLGLGMAGVPLNLEGFAYQVTSATADQMLSEVTSMMAHVGSHADLLRRLHDQRPLNDLDVPDLEGEAYKLVVEKAMEHNAWRQYMEPVRKSSTDPTTAWVTKDVANNPTLGYVKAS